MELPRLGILGASVSLFSEGRSGQIEPPRTGILGASVVLGFVVCSGQMEPPRAGIFGASVVLVFVCCSGQIDPPRTGIFGASPPSMGTLLLPLLMLLLMLLLKLLTILKLKEACLGPTDSPRTGIFGASPPSSNIISGASEPPRTGILGAPPPCTVEEVCVVVSFKVPPNDAGVCEIVTGSWKNEKESIPKLNTESYDTEDMLPLPPLHVSSARSRLRRRRRC